MSASVPDSENAQLGDRFGLTPAYDDKGAGFVIMPGMEDPSPHPQPLDGALTHDDDYDC